MMGMTGMMRMTETVRKKDKTWKQTQGKLWLGERLDCPLISGQ